MVKEGSKDLYHEVNLRACELALQLAQALGTQLWGVSKPMVAALMPLTTHRRSAVRVAALGALRLLMACGAQELILEMVAWRDPNMVAIKAFYEGEVKVRSMGLCPRVLRTPSGSPHSDLLQALAHTPSTGRYAVAWMQFGFRVWGLGFTLHPCCSQTGSAAFTPSRR